MFVSTSTPCRVAVPVSTPSRVETVAKWKVVKKKTKLRPRKVSESARRHVGCTTYPEMPPPPPQFTIIQSQEAPVQTAQEAPVQTPAAAQEEA